MNYIDSYLLFTLKLLKELFLLTASSAIISRQCPVDAIIGSIRAEVALRQQLATKALSGHSFVAHRYASGCRFRLAGIVRNFRSMCAAADWLS